MIQTVSLETAKLLKEAGFRQDTEMFWYPNPNGTTWDYILVTKDFKRVSGGLIYTAAPTTDELLEELPSRLNEHSGVLLIFKETDAYEVCYGGHDNRFINVSLPEALAQCWLWLRKEKLI